MKNTVLKKWFHNIQRIGAMQKRVKINASGKSRFYDVYAINNDTFFIEVGFFEHHTDSRLPCLIMKKNDLNCGKTGFVMTASIGNYSTILMPLLDGTLDKTIKVLRNKRSHFIKTSIVFAGIRGSAIEIISHDLEIKRLEEADKWLQSHNLPLANILFQERKPQIVKYCRERGQEWRIRSKVFTLEEKNRLVAQAHHASETATHYYQSVNGQLYLSYQDFLRVADLAVTKNSAFVNSLTDWVALNGQMQSNFRRIQNGVRSIELLGLPDDVADSLIIPALERILEGITVNRCSPEDASTSMRGIGMIFKASLTKPYFADEKSSGFIKNVYDLLYGKDGNAKDSGYTFDERRVAVPGVTFNLGQPVFHANADTRSRAMIEHLIKSVNVKEEIQFINIYDVRSTKTMDTGGMSREIVYKTNRTPKQVSLVEKRLASTRQGYGSYMLARVNAFRALGSSYPTFRLIEHQNDGRHSKDFHYFLRTRCPGEPLNSIPAQFFYTTCPAVANLNFANESERIEDETIVVNLVSLYGEAAAQTLIDKKYLPATHDCRFGINKEIFEFRFSPERQREIPVAVRVCSIRGIMGWQDLSRSDLNINEIYRIYLRVFAAKLCDYWLKHRQTCSLNDLACAFFDGFERKTKFMYWQYTHSKEEFDSFNPNLRKIFNFQNRWSFALWALIRHYNDLPELRERFMDYVRDSMVNLRNTGKC